MRGTFAAGTNGTEFTVSSTGNLIGGSYNKVTITTPTNSATLTIADQKTLTVNNSLTFSGADSKTINFGSNSLTLTTSGDSSLTLPISGTLIANPMATLGDLIYGGASGAPTQLAGAAGFLKSTGAAAPSWSAIALSDVSVPVIGSPSSSDKSQQRLRLYVERGCHLRRGHHGQREWYG